ncbi:MAG: hypothetical protein QHJ73_07115 [Armatimonadota bacterium]|nr:hypothetical protein [Armatimonadota bacterium]
MRSTLPQRAWLFSALALTTLSAAPAAKGESLTPELIFQSGFEESCQVVPGRGSDNDVVGKDATLPGKNDWVEDLERGLGCSFSLQYTGGDESKRIARIVPDPVNPRNRVLQFRITDAWVADGNAVKARVQANIYGIRPGLKEFYQSVRVFLPEDWRALRRYPRGIRWLTISEFWNNSWWGADPHGFRITLGLGKPTADESDLFFILDAEDTGRKMVWSADNHEVKVPIGEWFTLEYYFKEGDSKSGRFYLAVTPADGRKRVVFDVTNYTHHTTDPAPDGLAHYNPLKLYTSKELVGFMKALGKPLEVYWDDFRLWRNRRP